MNWIDYFDLNQLSSFIEVLGTGAFAVSGALMAIKYKLDIVGVFTSALVTAIGGGTLRDLLLGTEVFWVDDYTIYGVVIVATITAILIRREDKKYDKPLFFFDSLGLGLFTITGVEKGISFEHSAIFCITLGVLTGCFGGIIRDVLVSHIPVVLRKEIYITACIIGGITHYLLTQLTNLQPIYPFAITMVLILLVRHIAVTKEINLPNFRK